MSGNPFRRTPSSRLPDLDTASDDTSTPPQRIKKKRVKIQTPPHSPEFPFSPQPGHRRLSASNAAGRADSPPPPPPSVSIDDDLSDSTATADSELEQAYLNTRRNSGTVPLQHPAPSSTAGMKAPYNPFARTLATKEAAYGLRMPDSDQKNQAGTDRRNNTGRPAMDVDAFKNILLTGSATPSPPVPASGATLAPRPQDSSSGTDTSSLSRHSIFDTSHDLHPESPRTSFDDYAGASDSESDGDREGTSLMGPNRPEELAPPAPPKPKHGKGPQTVSFADFDQSIPSDFHAPLPRTPSATAQPASILRPTLERSSSDLNKPLPLPPQDPFEQSLPELPQDSLPPQPYTELSPAPEPAVTDESVQPKKVPPPPPASRRQAAGPSRPRSTSGATQSSTSSDQDQDETEVPTRSDMPATKSAPPPPPPSRKSQNTNTSATPVSDPLPEPRLSSESPASGSKVMPPPPPRRLPSKTGDRPAVARTPSAANRSIAPYAETSSGGNLAPPPPPPPRRGQGSQRSSTDGPPPPAGRIGGSEGSRLSGQSFGSDGSGLKQVAEPDDIDDSASSLEGQIHVQDQQQQRDILADMSAFQAEIDALRARDGR